MEKPKPPIKSKPKINQVGKNGPSTAAMSPCEKPSEYEEIQGGNVKELSQQLGAQIMSGLAFRHAAGQGIGKPENTIITMEPASAQANSSDIVGAPANDRVPSLKKCVKESCKISEGEREKANCARDTPSESSEECCSKVWECCIMLFCCLFG